MAFPKEGKVPSAYEADEDVGTYFAGKHLAVRSRAGVRKRNEIADAGAPRRSPTGLHKIGGLCTDRKKSRMRVVEGADPYDHV